MTYFASIKTLNKMMVGLMVAALFAAAFIATGPAAKAASNDGTSVGGEANLSGSLIFTGIKSDLGFSKNLNGTNQTADSTFMVEVLDTLASPEGWQITATMESFVLNGNGTKTLAPVMITSATASNTLGNAANEANLNGGVQLDPVNSSMPIFWTANENEVQQAQVTFGARLAIPADTVAGIYNSSIDLTLSPRIS